MEVKAAKSCTRTTLSSLIRKTKKTKNKKEKKKMVSTPTTSQCVEEMRRGLIGCSCSSKSHMDRGVTVNITGSNCHSSVQYW
jgi:hypothetical protein